MTAYQKLAYALTQQHFTFAKTMPKQPHHYTLRKHWQGEFSFDEIVQLLRDNSVERDYKGRTYRYFILNGFKYWTMGAPIKDTILINRAEDKQPAVYDKIADQYAGMFLGIDSIEEDQYVFSLIAGDRSDYDTVLDIGCGTGLALTYVKFSSYQGVDPSEAMLAKARAREVAFTNFCQCQFEHFYPCKVYDQVLCLFGSAGYLTTPELKRAYSMVAAGGQLAVMLFKPGYHPVTHQVTGIDPPITYHDPVELPHDEVIEVGDYQLLLWQKPNQ